MIEELKDNLEKEIFFFDESRFGTHSKIGHGWFIKGSRTKVKMKLGFQNFYLYSAINPVTGEDFTLMAPNVNTKNMNIFLEQFAAQHSRDLIFILDCAGWHKSKDLKIPPNVEIRYLPPYSPELNPVERFWQYIKQHIVKNKVYHDLQALEKAVVEFFSTFDRAVITSLCNFNYMLK